MAKDAIEGRGERADSALDLPRAHCWRKRAGIVAGSLILAIAALLLAPAFVDLGIFKSTYLPWLEETLQRRIDVGEVHLRLIPVPSIRVSNLTVFDHPAFSNNALFSADQLRLHLRLWPLLRGRFEITEFVLDQPIVNFLKQPDGRFNYAAIAGKKTAAAGKVESQKKTHALKPMEPALPLLIPSRMRVKNGQLNLLARGERPVKINGIDLSLQNFSAQRPFFYRVSFDYPGLKTISLEGKLSYQGEQGMLQLQDNRLEAHEIVLPLDGSVSQLANMPRVNLRAASDRVEAKRIFEILAVFGAAPSDAEVSGPVRLRLTVTGPVHSLASSIDGQLHDVKLDSRQSLRGRLSGEISLRLPPGGGAIAQRLLGKGKLVARDGELTHRALMEKLKRATSLIGLSANERREATTFQSLESDFIIGSGVAEFKRIHAVNPQMELNGRGTMTLERPTLNLGIEAKLSPQASARAGRGRTSRFFQDRQGSIVVPLRITGRLEQPSVHLDDEKLAKRGVSGSWDRSVASFFKELFQSRR